MVLSACRIFSFVNNNNDNNNKNENQVSNWPIFAEFTHNFHGPLALWLTV